MNLPFDDSAPVVLVVGGLEVRFEDRRVGFLDLEDQRVVVAAAVEQRDPATGPDAADADHLAGGVDEAVPIEEVLALVGQTGPVVVEQRCDAAQLVVAGYVSYQRELIDDPTVSVDDCGELRDGLEPVVHVRACDGLVGQSFRFRSGVFISARTVLGVDAPVPHVQGRERRNVGHGVRVGQRDPFDRVVAVLVVEALRPGRNRETGTEPLEIPLPRSGQCLVEVVHIEDQPPVGRAEPSEVDEMGVAAQLHGNLRRRGPGEVGGHHRRRTTVETER